MFNVARNCKCIYRIPLSWAVIYYAFCLDVVHGRMDAAPSENQTHSCWSSFLIIILPKVNSFMSKAWYFLSRVQLVFIQIFLLPRQSVFIISSSSSCRVISTDIPDPLSPPLPIAHRFWQVLMATPRILTELLYVGSSWPPCFCTAMWRGFIGLHHLWARLYFSSSVPHVWFV